MSLTLMSTSSTDEPAMISKDGNALLAHVDLDRASDRGGRRAAARAASRASAAPARASSPACSSQLGRRRQRRQQQIEQPLLGRLARLLAHFGDPLLADHVDGDLGQVADHRLDVAADVADLGELRRFDLDERRLRQPRQPPRDLGLADAGRADHQDVLRRDLLGQLRAAASAAACGCAARSPPRASPCAGRRRTCRARGRSRAASATRRSRSVVSDR